MLFHATYVCRGLQDGLCKEVQRLQNELKEPMNEKPRRKDNEDQGYSATKIERYLR